MNTSGNVFESWALHVLETSWQAVVLAVVVLVLVLFLRERLSARWRCVLWLVVAVKLLLPAVPQSPVSLFNLVPGNLPRPAAADQFPRTTAVTPFVETAPVGCDATEDLDKNAPQRQSETFAEDFPPTGKIADAPPASTSTLQPMKNAERSPPKTSRKADLSIWWFLGLFWLAGATIVAGHFALLAIRLQRLLRQCRPVADLDIEDIFDFARREAGVRRYVELVVSPMKVGLAVTGVFRLRLIISHSLLDSLTASEMRLVFLHELAHLRRHDMLVQRLWILAKVVHWFNPVVWWADRRWQADRELACDELVLAQLDPDVRMGYGKTVLRVIELLATLRPIPGTLPVARSDRSLTRRISMIASYDSHPRQSPLLAVVLLLILIPLGLTNATAQPSAIPQLATSPAPSPPASPTGKTATHEASSVTPNSEEPKTRDRLQDRPKSDPTPEAQQSPKVESSPPAELSHDKNDQQETKTAGPLRYAPQPNIPYHYEVEIQVDLPNEKQAFQGTLSYTSASDGEPLRITSEGRLTGSRQMKPNPSPDPFGFNPGINPGFGPHSVSKHVLLDPFSFDRYDFFPSSLGIKGRFTLDRQGNCHVIEGDTTLPYLIGSSSLLVFEPLPEANKDAWTVKSKLSLSENDFFPQSQTDGWPYSRFRTTAIPRMPGFPDQNDQTPQKIFHTTAVTSFSQCESQGDLVSFHKKLELEVPNDKQSLSVVGEGRWVFNLRRNMSESLNYQTGLVVNRDHIAITIPITVKYQLLTDEQWAQHLEKQKTALERHKIESKKRAAEKKTPLGEGERQEILADLKSNDSIRQTKALLKLRKKEEQNDQEIETHLRLLIAHSDQSLAQLAQKALEIYSPEFKKKNELNEQYSGSMPVKQTGPAMTPETPLPPGLIVAYREHPNSSFWQSAKVVQAIADDLVVIQPLNRDEKKAYPRSELRLAPPEFDQPEVKIKDAARSTSPDKTPQPNLNNNLGYRTWTDDSGEHQITAKYLGVDGNNVRLLRKKDHQEIIVSLNRLSQEDRQLVQILQGLDEEDPFQ